MPKESNHTKETAAAQKARLSEIEKRVSRSKMFEGDEAKEELDALDNNQEMSCNACVFLVECMLEDWKKKEEIDAAQCRDFLLAVEVKAKRAANTLTVAQAKQLIKEVEENKEKAAPAKDKDKHAENKKVPSKENLDDKKPKAAAKDKDTPEGKNKRAAAKEKGAEKKQNAKQDADERNIKEKDNADDKKKKAAGNDKEADKKNDDNDKNKPPAKENKKANEKKKKPPPATSDEVTQ